MGKVAAAPSGLGADQLLAEQISRRRTASRRTTSRRRTTARRTTSRRTTPRRKTTSRRKTSHRTTSPSPHGDVLARAHHRKGSLHRSEEKVFCCEDEPRIPSLRTPSLSSLRARTCTSQKGFSTQIVRRKGSVARHRHPAAIGFGLPIRPLLLIPDEVFTGDHTVKVRPFARSDTSDADGILLAARNVASPGYFRYPYRRRFRTTDVRCFS